VGFLVAEKYNKIILRMVKEKYIVLHTKLDIKKAINILKDEI